MNRRGFFGNLLKGAVAVAALPAAKAITESIPEAAKPLPEAPPLKPHMDVSVMTSQCSSVEPFPPYTTYTRTYTPDVMYVCSTAASAYPIGIWHSTSLSMLSSGV